MKWKVFKEYAEKHGVNDDTDFCYEDSNFGGNDGDVDEHNFIIDRENNELRIKSKYYVDLG